ncbi:hypothetical protein NQT62_06785 [Limnobacter humi]|uniref:SMP-30/Gluconolactonase/LRE-like region domain-containing protein n=1 Tax=Limnobacter humi TaxID=1778671 RepID=A0ABT1WF46_9BURK|nr:hypothetical protein [Limnobacter humi]MCQ8896142.1 hypothetical protein [Limnobacter humi]
MFITLKRASTAILAAGCFAQTACTSDSASTATTTGRTSAAEVSSLCFENGCADAVPLLTVPDAENMIFSDSGRLFVSGGTGVFEVTQAATGKASGFSLTALNETACNFTGLAIQRQVLYANCGDGTLWAARLDGQPMRLNKIFTYSGVALTNGLVDGPDGRSLYAADGPLSSSALPSPKLIRLELDVSNPMVVQQQSTWLDLTGRFPNGIQRHGNILYFTDSAPPNLGQLNAVAVRSDASAGTPFVIATLPQLPDDFSILPDGSYAMTYYLTGQIAHISPTGAVLASTTPLTFSTGPSQVRQGRAPLFSSQDLLVTEKGIIGDNNSPVGNTLTLFRKR